MTYFQANRSIQPSYVTSETFEGKEYWIAPVVLMCVGVYSGSNGPLYYPPDELESSVPSWNMKPLVVAHPANPDGTHISASSVDVLKKQQVGFLLNVRFDGKLRADAWIDKTKADSIDPRIGKALTANRMMEVSTGLFYDSVTQNGMFGTEQYSKIAVNLRPDHLAILPTGVGACSIKDGAGLLQTNSKHVPPVDQPTLFGSESNPLWLQIFNLSKK